MHLEEIVEMEYRMMVGNFAQETVLCKTAEVMVVSELTSTAVMVACELTSTEVMVVCESVEIVVVADSAA